MERFNAQRILGRIKRTGNSEGESTQSNNKKYAAWAGWAVLAVVALGTCSLLFTGSLARNAINIPGSSNVGPLPAMMPTPAAEADKFVAGYTDGRQSAPATGSGADDYLSTQQSNNGTTTQPQPKPWDRKILRTATLQLTVKDVVASVDKVRLLAALHGGYVFQSDSHQDGEYTVANITIQVPTQEFDQVMPELRKLDGQVKKITSENVSSNDVTEEYVDLQSQLRNLQATESRILALQAKAERLEDILALDQQIRGIQGDIERIQGRLNFLGNRSDLSSISVSLTPEMLPPQPIDPEPVKAWDPVEVARKAWESSLDMLSGVATVAITATVFMWWTIPLILIALVVATRLRKRPTGRTPSAPAPPATSAGEASA